MDTKNVHKPTEEVIRKFAEALDSTPAHLTGQLYCPDEIMKMSDYQAKFAKLALKEVKTLVNDRDLPGFLRSNMESTVKLLAELIKACNG